VRAASIIIALVMEATRTSETSVDIQLRTRQYIPEDSDLQLYFVCDKLDMLYFVSVSQAQWMWVPQN
jgi:hypothetical protein